MGFGTETLLQRVCRLTVAVARPVIVVAASEQQLPDLTTDAEVTRDLFPGQGPLAGLLTGLQYLRNQRPQQWPNLMIWATTCDAPFVNIAVIQYLKARLLAAPECSAVTVGHQGKQNPFAAVYRSRVLDTVETLFASGNRRAQSLLQQSNVLTVDSSELIDFDPELLFLRNVNDAQQLAEARSHL